MFTVANPPDFVGLNDFGDEACAPGMPIERKGRALPYFVDLKQPKGNLRAHERFI